MTEMTDQLGGPLAESQRDPVQLARLHAAHRRGTLNGRRIERGRSNATPGNRRMNKSELSTHVADQVSVSRATADSVVSALFSSIGDALARDDTVAIAAFGMFTTRARAARQGRNPRTGENLFTSPAPRGPGEDAKAPPLASAASVQAPHQRGPATASDFPMETSCNAPNPRLFIFRIQITNLESSSNDLRASS